MVRNDARDQKKYSKNKFYLWKEKSLDIAHVDEEAYLSELVAYLLHFERYKYDQLTSKLVEIHVDVFQKSSPMQSVVVAINFQGEPVVTITEELEPIRGGVELATIPYILYLSTKLVKVPVVVF